MAELDLLPPNALAESRQRAEVMSRISELPTPVKDTWNPQRCPTPLLPYLAWAMSVDHWNPDWDEATKRRVIAASWDTHAHKGTVHAVEQAVAALGLSAELEEWIENNQRQRGTFGVQIPVGPNTPSLSPALQADIEAAISRAKRASQHHDLSLAAKFNSPLYIGFAGSSGSQQAVDGCAAGRRGLDATQGQAAAAHANGSTQLTGKSAGRNQLIGQQAEGSALFSSHANSCAGESAGRRQLNAQQAQGSALFSNRADRWTGAGTGRNQLFSSLACGGSGHLERTAPFTGQGTGRNHLMATPSLATQGIYQQSVQTTAHSSGRQALVIHRSGRAVAHLSIVHIRGMIS